jgi:hypothetical protein
MTLKSIPNRPWLYYELMTSDNLMICPECNGTGANPEYADLNLDLYNAQVSWGRDEKSIIFVRCSKCYGAGNIDWIEGIIGKEKGEDDELFTTPISVCIEFLISALIGPNKDYGILNYYDINKLCWRIDWVRNNMDYSLKCFNMHKSIVSKYMTEFLRDEFNRAINIELIFKGQACTKCFSLVTDEILYDSLKEKYKIIPFLPGDEVNYKALFTPDTNFPLFRLCDSCQKNMAQSEITHLKRVAFDKNYPEHFSAEFLEKINSLTFLEGYI